MQTFIFIGRSGCGKGTQLELLKEYLSKKSPKVGIKSIVMGEIFRDFFKKEGYIQEVAKDLSMKQGKFQPDFLTNALFINKAIEIIDQESFLFFDGYPRNISQLDIIKKLFKYIKRENYTVVNIEVSKESVKQRMLSRRRGDDNEVAIENRLSEFDTFVVPMIEEIKKDPSFNYIEIDGEPTPEEIHKDIISKLEL